MVDQRAVAFLAVLLSVVKAESSDNCEHVGSPPDYTYEFLLCSGVLILISFSIGVYYRGSYFLQACLACFFNSRSTHSVLSILFEFWDILLFPFLQIIDLCSDFFLCISFLHDKSLFSNNSLFNVAIFCSFITFVVHPILTTYLSFKDVGSQAGMTRFSWRHWGTAFLQFIQLRFLLEIRNAFRQEKPRLTYELRMLKKWETILESLPQLVIQIYFIFNHSQNGEINSFLYISLAITILSVTLSLTYTDQFGLNADKKTFRRFFGKALFFIIRLCDVLLHCFLIGIFAALYEAKWTVVYGVLIVLLSIGLRFWENRYTQQLTSVDIIEYGFLNFFTMDLLYDSIAASCINFIKLLEILAGLSVVIYQFNNQDDDCHSDQFEEFVYIISVILWVCLTIVIFGLLLVHLLGLFDFQNYRASRLRSPVNLCKQNKHGYVWWLVKRREIDPAEANKVFYELGKSGKISVESMTRANMRPNPRDIIDTFNDFDFLLKTAVNSNIYPKETLDEGKETSEQQELVGVLIEYLINGGKKPMAETPKDPKAIQLVRRIDDIEREIAKLTKQKLELENQLKNVNAFGSEVMLSTSKHGLPTEERLQSDIHTDAVDEKSEKISTTSQERVGIKKVLFMDEIIVRLLVVLRDMENIGEFQNLPDPAQELYIDDCIATITVEDMKLILEKFGFRDISDNTISDFFDKVSHYDDEESLSFQSFRSNESETQALTKVRKLLNINVLDKTLGEQGLLRVKTKLGRAISSAPTRMFRSGISGMTDLENCDSFPRSRGGTTRTLADEDDGLPVLSDEDCDISDLTSPRLSRNTTDMMPTMRSPKLNNKSNGSYFSTFKDTLRSIFSSTPSKTPAIDVKVELEQAPISLRRQHTLDSCKKPNTKDITFAQLCYYLVMNPKHPFVSTIQALLKHPKVLKHSRIFPACTDCMRKYFEKAKHEILVPKHKHNHGRLSAFEAQLIDYDDMTLQINVVDKVPWFSTLSHQKRAQITKHLKQYKLPAETGWISDEDYDDYFYIVHDLREPACIRFALAPADYPFQNHDVFGWRTFSMNMDDSSPRMKGKIFYECSSRIALYRIGGDKLAAIYGKELPKWISSEGFWRELPHFDGLKNLKRTMLDEDRELQRAIIDFAPLFSKTLSCERDLLVRSATLRKVNNTIENTEDKIYLIQSGIVKIYRNVAGDPEIRPPVAGQVIGFITNFKNRRNTLAEVEGNSSFGIECMSTRPARLIELQAGIVELLRRRMSSIFASYNDDCYDLFFRPKSWDSRLRKMQLLCKSEASKNPKLPSMKKYLVTDVLKNADEMNDAYFQLTEVSKNEIVTTYDTDPIMLRFVAQAKYISRMLTRPDLNSHFVSFVDSFNDSDTFFTTTEYVQGVKLMDCLKSGRLMQSSIARQTRLQKNAIKGVVERFHERINDDLPISRLPGKHEKNDEETNKEIRSLIFQFLFTERVSCIIDEESLGKDGAYATEYDVRFFAANMFLILEKLHRAHIVHRNMTLDNFWIGKDGYLVLDNFDDAVHIGYDQLHGDKEPAPGCDHRYCSPELINDDPYGFSVDSWSIGVCLYVMLVGTFPFQNPKKAFRKGNQQLLVVDFLSDEAMSFLDLLFLDEIGDDINELLGHVKHHPWFKGFDWEALERRDISKDDIPYIPQNDIFAATPATFLDNEIEVERESIKLGSNERKRLQLVEMHMGRPRVKVNIPLYNHLERALTSYEASSDSLKLVYLTYDPLLLVDEDGKRVASVLPPLAFLQEERDIITAIEESEFVVDFFNGVFSKSTLERVPDLHIIHVSGHGQRRSTMIEDDSGSNTILSDQFAECFQDTKLALIMCCHSETMGNLFIKMNVDHVIAISDSETINDSSARIFSRNFYRFLLNDRMTIQDAFERACNAIEDKKEGQKFLLLPKKDGDHDKKLEEIFEVFPKNNLRHSDFVKQIGGSVPQNMIDGSLGCKNNRFVVDGENAYRGIKSLELHHFLLVHGPNRFQRTQMCNEIAINLRRLGFHFPKGVFVVQFRDVIETREELAEAIMETIRSIHRYSHYKKTFQSVDRCLKELPLALFLTQHPSSENDDWFPKNIEQQIEVSRAIFDLWKITTNEGMASLCVCLSGKSTAAMDKHLRTAKLNNGESIFTTITQVIPERFLSKKEDQKLAVEILHPDLDIGKALFSHMLEKKILVELPWSFTLIQEISFLMNQYIVKYLVNSRKPYKRAMKFIKKVTFCDEELLSKELLKMKSMEKMVRDFRKHIEWSKKLESYANDEEQWHKSKTYLRLHRNLKKEQLTVEQWWDRMSEEKKHAVYCFVGEVMIRIASQRRHWMPTWDPSSEKLKRKFQKRFQKKSEEMTSNQINFLIKIFNDENLITSHANEFYNVVWAIKNIEAIEKEIMNKHEDYTADEIQLEVKKKLPEELEKDFPKIYALLISAYFESDSVQSPRTYETPSQVTIGDASEAIMSDAWGGSPCSADASPAESPLCASWNSLEEITPVVHGTTERTPL